MYAKSTGCFVLTFALDSGRRSEGRPELLGAPVAARRHVVRYLQERQYNFNIPSLQQNSAFKRGEGYGDCIDRSHLDELVPLHDDRLPVLAGAAAARVQPDRRAGVRALTHRRRRVLVGLARLALAGVQDLQWGSVTMTPEYL